MRAPSLKIYFISLCIVVCGCVSNKYGVTQNVVSRVYHNTTARYNAYFYGDLKLHQIEKKFNKEFKDDYSKILPLFVEPGGKSKADKDLDSIVIRMNKVVARNTDNKDKPKTKWIDDCYFDMGKAYYYKGDFEKAKETFQYVSTNFKDNTKLNKKGKPKHVNYRKLNAKRQKHKDDEDQPTVTLPPQPHKLVDKFKHRVVVYKAVLWLIKSYTQDENFDQANAVANAALQKPSFPNALRPELLAMQANIFIKSENYAEAIKPLTNALALTKNKRNKARYAYVLAQLYQALKKDDNSADYFKRVLSYKPGTEMEFYANINLAKSFTTGGKQNAQDIIDKLLKMAADKRYFEFRDQIYYEVGEVYLKTNTEDNAISYYHKSAESYINNKAQLGLTYLRLANLDFKNEQFVHSKTEFDTTLQFLPKDNADYTDASVKQSVLSDLIRHLNTIHTEDSLQKIAGRKDIDKYLANYIERKKEEEEKAAAEKAAKEANKSNVQEVSNSSSGGTWYFYNTVARSQGYTDFIQKWGKRTLEDNWRRSKKSSNDFNSNDQAATKTDSAAHNNAGNSNEVTVEKLKANLPTTPEKLKASTDKIVDAYYNIGVIYKEKLHADKKAIEIFEKLMKLYPANKYELQTAYYLYILYTKAGNAEKAAYYRKLILDKYPDSDAAHIILDPQYFTKMQQKANEVKEFYASTYTMYKNGQMQDVLARIHDADAKYNPNPIKVKFDLLKTLASAQTLSRDSFKLALTSFMKKYPSGEENKAANEVLKLLNRQIAHDDSLANIENIRRMRYVFDDKGAQYLLIVFNSIDGRIKTLADSITAYNAKHHAEDHLEVTIPLFTNTRQMILVKKMVDKENALNYFYEINNLKVPFKPLKGMPYNIFIVDEKGFTTLMLKKDVEEYLKFFYDKYLQ